MMSRGCLKLGGVMNDGMNPGGQEGVDVDVSPHFLRVKVLVFGTFFKIKALENLKMSHTCSQHRRLSSSDTERGTDSNIQRRISQNANRHFEWKQISPEI